MRRAPTAQEVWPWEVALRAPERRWWHLLFNPAGTYTLAAQGQVERLHSSCLNHESEQSDAVISRALVEQLAEARVPPAWRSKGWQWRIVVRDRGHETETLRSDVLS